MTRNNSKPFGPAGWTPVRLGDLRGQDSPHHRHFISMLGTNHYGHFLLCGLTLPAPLCLPSRRVADISYQNQR